MPTTYAHDLFGKRVYQRLNGELQKKIRENQAIFQIGVHGPDIFFYHKPFQKNPVSQLGSKMHREAAAGFFLEGKKRYMEKQEDALLVYLLGFICHFILDSNCHPFVNEYEATGAASHDQIETDFDRYLIEKTGKDPFSFKPGNAIHPSKNAVDVISLMIDGVSEKELMKSLKGIRFFTGITVGGKVYRTLLRTIGEKIGIRDYARSKVLLEEPYESCKESTRELARLFEKAIPEAVSVIEEYVQKIEETDHISDRFLRNYD